MAKVQIYCNIRISINITIVVLFLHKEESLFDTQKSPIQVLSNLRLSVHDLNSHIAMICERNISPTSSRSRVDRELEFCSSRCCLNCLCKARTLICTLVSISCCFCWTVMMGSRARVRLLELGLLEAVVVDVDRWTSPSPRTVSPKVRNMRI